MLNHIPLTFTDGSAVLTLKTCLQASLHGLFVSDDFTRCFRCLAFLSPSFKNHRTFECIFDVEDLPDIIWNFQQKIVLRVEMHVFEQC